MSKQRDDGWVELTQEIPRWLERLFAAHAQPGDRVRLTGYRGYLDQCLRVELLRMHTCMVDSVSAPPPPEPEH